MQNLQSEPAVKNSPNPNVDLPLNSAQRLALHIIGAMAMNGHLTNTTINPFDNGLSMLYQDITDAIKSGLPEVDHAEILNLLEGKSAE